MRANRFAALCCIEQRKRSLATSLIGGDDRLVIRRIVAAVFVAFASTAFLACSMFHHGDVSPQQQFMSALQHGNGPQMNQIWLNMSPDDRANLAHSRGFKPLTSPDEVKAKLKQAAEAQNQDAEADGSGFVANDGGAQQIEVPTVNTNGGGLGNLPGLSGSSAPTQ